MSEKRQLTVAEVAKQFRVAARTVQKWASLGLLPARKFGRDWMIEEASANGFTPPANGRRPKKKETAT